MQNITWLLDHINDNDFFAVHVILIDFMAAALALVNLSFLFNNYLAGCLVIYFPKKSLK